MRKLLHSIVVLGILSVVGFGYWSSARAQSDQGGGIASVQSQEVTGVIEAIDANSLTVDGIVYQITDQTDKQGALQVGDSVKLEFTVNEDGTFTAQEIDSETELDTPDSGETEDVSEESNDDQGTDVDANESEDSSAQQDTHDAQHDDGGQTQEAEHAGGDD
jgi:hypothetical protein